MTQPYPQYAPQGYAPAPQQYAPPAPQGYAPAPNVGGQPIAPPAPPVPTLRDGGGGGAASPKMRHLVGRTIVVVPQRVDDTKTNKEGKPQPEAYFDLIVVDGGPMRYGDNQEDDPAKQRPNTHEIDTPCVFHNTSDYGFGFVQAVRDALAAGEPGRVGVVERSTQGRKPYLITKTGTTYAGAERPDGQARFDAAMHYFGLYWQDKHAPVGTPRQFVNPEPRSLVAPAPQGYAQPAVNYGAPAQPPAQPYGFAAQQYAQTGTVPTPYGSVPAAAVHPQYAAAATGGAYPAPAQPYAAPQSVSPAPPQPSAYAVAAAPEMATMAAQLPAPVEAWLASLPADQQAAQRAAYLQHAAAQQAPGAPAGPGI